MKIIEKIERFGLKSITGISIILTFSVLSLDLIPYFFLKNTNLISTTNTLTFIGAIFVFWYGYKKYERDKELDIIKELDLINSLKVSNLSNFLNNWVKNYILYKKEYINKDIWEIIEKGNKNHFFIFLSNNLNKSYGDIIKHIESLLFNTDLDFTTYLKANVIQLKTGLSKLDFDYLDNDEEKIQKEEENNSIINKLGLIELLIDNELIIINSQKKIIPRPPGQ